MKMDTVRGLNPNTAGTEQSRPTAETTLDEQQMLEMRLELLNQQEMKKLKDNAELLKILNSLHSSIKEAGSEVQRAAREVRGYPVEVISQVSARIEHSIKQCEQSAKKAQETYNEATQLVIYTEKTMLWWVLGASFLSPMVLAGILIAWRW